ncbi:MAG: antitoxin VbhA family protein [Desulfovibrionaceae bacterium]|nr:antitoxin VbhA family protein [Desulfovibrionaceae bacterium]
MYKPIPIDRDSLTIMGVPFPSQETWESAASAIGSNMFEGWEPTRKGIELIRDYMLGKLSFKEFVQAAKDKAHAEQPLHRS